jgi:hypothetical protein
MFRSKLPALARRILPALRRQPHVGMDVLGKLIGIDDAIAIRVRLALDSLDDVVGKDPMPATPTIALEALFAVPARRQREQRLLQIEQRIRHLLPVGLRCDRAGVAGVRNQHLPLTLDLAADHRTQRVHRVRSRGDVVQIDVIWSPAIPCRPRQIRAPQSRSAHGRCPCVTDGSHTSSSCRMFSTVARSLISLCTFSAGNCPPSG